MVYSGSYSSPSAVELLLLQVGVLQHLFVKEKQSILCPLTFVSTMCWRKQGALFKWLIFLWFVWVLKNIEIEITSFCKLKVHIWWNIWMFSHFSGILAADHWWLMTTKRRLLSEAEVSSGGQNSCKFQRTLCKQIQIVNKYFTETDHLFILFLYLYLTLNCLFVRSCFVMLLMYIIISVYTWKNTMTQVIFIWYNHRFILNEWFIFTESIQIQKCCYIYQ